MVAPLIAAGARAAAGGAARKTAAQQAGRSAVAGAEERSLARQVRARAQGQTSSEGQGRMEKRISKPVAGLMVAGAVIVDGAQFVMNLVPVLGQFFGLMLSFIAFVSFALWFGLMGVNFFSGRKAGMKVIAAFGTTIIELVPLVQALPALTMGVTVTIIITWFEDAENKEAALKKARELAQQAKTKDDEFRARIERFRARQEQEPLPT